MNTNSIIKNTNDEIDLGPIPELKQDWIKEVEDGIITDRSYEDFENNFVMPAPCFKCYRISCYEDYCEEEINLNLVPCRLDFGVEDEEEFDLPQQPETLRRMLTNAHLPEDLPEVVPEEYEETNY
jgi:hypothetical protein